jgi:hypothetical protein
MCPQGNMSFPNKRISNVADIILQDIDGFLFEHFTFSLRYSPSIESGWDNISSWFIKNPKPYIRDLDAIHAFLDADLAITDFRIN